MERPSGSWRPDLPIGDPSSKKASQIPNEKMRQGKFAVDDRLCGNGVRRGGTCLADVADLADLARLAGFAVLADLAYLAARRRYRRNPRPRRFHPRSRRRFDPLTAG